MSDTTLETQLLSFAVYVAFLVGAVVAAYLTHLAMLNHAHARGRLAPTRFMWSYALLIIGYFVLISAAYVGYGALTLLSYVPAISPVLIVLPLLIFGGLLLASGLFVIRRALSSTLSQSTGGEGA